jgi:hypothetical protein
LKRSLPVNLLLTLFFAALSMAVMGYHPAFEDDGIYLAAVKGRLNPALYPHDARFFQLQLQASFFDKWVAALVRWSSLPLAVTEFLLQFATIALIVFACWTIARKLFRQAHVQWAGVALVSAMFTLPVAGTAIYLVDQHLHPRGVATALILLAVSRILDNRRWQAALFLLLALVLHPLMAALGISFCIFLAAMLIEPVQARLEQWQGRRSLAAALIPMGWIVEPPTAAWRKALETRTSLYLYHWTWYEWLGALAPIFLFWLLWRLTRERGQSLLARFALAVVLYGLFQQTVAMIILGSPALIRLAPMQPMRYLHLIYFFLMLVGGCLIGKYLLQASLWRWAVFLVAINAGMFCSQRMLLASSMHLELPSRTSDNPWIQAFTWIRQKTPTDAYFALDPDYMAAPGEDYHSFRALAERSQLADNIKDTAVVTQVPELGEDWEQQVKAQTGWRHFQLADFERLKSEFGVNWVLVDYPAPTGLACQWHNVSLAVCQVP